MSLSGMSNISTDGLQTRYEKALKQINKLIEINRELKERVMKYEEEMSGCEQEKQQLEQMNRQLDEENNMLDSKYMELNNHCQELEMYCKKLEQEIDNYEINTEHVNERIRDTEIKHHQELELEIQKYNALATQAQYAQHTYQEAYHHYQDEKDELLVQIQQLKAQNIELKETNAKLNQLISEKNIVTMQAHLEQANKNIDNLIKECNELKAKEIDFEVLEERQKVERYIGLGTSIREQKGEAVKELILQYKKKLRETENQKKQIQQKYKHLKLKMAKAQNTDNFNKKIESLQRLTQKQQREIGTIIQTYDRELNAVHKDNVKIRQAYNMLYQTLSKRGREITQKQRLISELKLTTDRIQFENQSLKKVNSNLKEDRQKKLRELIRDQVQNTESVTLGHIRSQSEQPDSNVKLRVSQVEKGVYTAKENEQAFMRSGFEGEQTHKIPITVSYNSGEKGDFKFIQSVNIINGYNVNLSETGRSNR